MEFSLVFLPKSYLLTLCIDLITNILTHADVYITVLSDDREKAENSQYVGWVVF